MGTTLIKEIPAYVLAFDPSLTAWGWSVVDIRTGRVVDSDCIKTESKAKKLRIRQGDDRVRRIGEILKELHNITTTYNIVLITSELPHGSQSASAAVMIGIAVSIVQCMGFYTDIPVEWFSEGDIKKHVLGKSSAGKEEMIRAMRATFGNKWVTGIKYKDEAVADSLGVYVTTRGQSQIFKALEKSFG